jgi:hypothetical protein
LCAYALHRSCQVSPKLADQWFNRITRDLERSHLQLGFERKFAAAAAGRSSGMLGSHRAVLRDLQREQRGGGEDGLSRMLASGVPPARPKQTRLAAPNHHAGKLMERSRGSQLFEGRQSVRAENEDGKQRSTQQKLMNAQHSAHQVDTRSTMRKSAGSKAYRLQTYGSQRWWRIAARQSSFGRTTTGVWPALVLPRISLSNSASPEKYIKRDTHSRREQRERTVQHHVIS